MSSPPLPDARLRRCADRVYQLGPRPLFELFRELQRGADVPARLEAYARLEPDTVRALGLDRFPAPLRSVDGGKP